MANEKKPETWETKKDDEKSEHYTTVLPQRLSTLTV
jgi:hypothetical protein